MTDSVVIVGSGPVGSFVAVLCSAIGFDVTVYEKRERFTRNYHVKIDNDSFKIVQIVLDRLKVNSHFFANLNDYLQRMNNRIVIRELEETLATEAQFLGAKYIRKEVLTFRELYEVHKTIIIDCTGRNSTLRTIKFGSDGFNIVTVPLQHAMYVHLKVKGTENVSLYQVMKYADNIKLAEAVISKAVDENGYSDMTIPVFTTKKLAAVFDKEYPNINRNPLNPFTSPYPVPDEIFFPISSLIGNLIVDGCTVDLKSVQVKKIEITCGYAERRSEKYFVCLGDSAIHLAFFKSLNLGLKHALDFFIKLSIFQKRAPPPLYDADEVLKLFLQKNPLLNAVKVYPTIAQNVYLVVTKLVWYGCYSFCLTDFRVEKLTSTFGVYESQINGILKQLNRNLRDWDYLLDQFEKIRNQDIRLAIESNLAQNFLYDSLSWFIDLNGQSVIKISEFARVVEGKIPLYLRDFEFLHTYFKFKKTFMDLNTDPLYAFYNMTNFLIEQAEPNESKAIAIIRAILSSRKLVKENKVRYIDKVLFRGELSSAKKVKQASVESPDNRSSIILALIRNERLQMKNLQISPKNFEECSKEERLIYFEILFKMPFPRRYPIKKCCGVKC